MTINESNSVIVTGKQIVYWWLVYVVLDMLFFGILNHLYFIYIGSSKDLPLESFIKIPLYGLLGLVGKTAAFPQFPLMLLFVYMFRKSLLIRWWCWIPLVSFVIAYSLFLVVTTLLDYSASWEVAIRALNRELGRWLDYRYALSATRPMALISTLLATVVWIVFLRKKWSYLNDAQ